MYPGHLDLPPSIRQCHLVLLEQLSPSPFWRHRLRRKSASVASAPSLPAERVAWYHVPDVTRGAFATSINGKLRARKLYPLSTVLPLVTSPFQVLSLNLPLSRHL